MEIKKKSFNILKIKEVTLTPSYLYDEAISPLCDAYIEAICEYRCQRTNKLLAVQSLRTQARKKSSKKEALRLAVEGFVNGRVEPGEISLYVVENIDPKTYIGPGIDHVDFSEMHEPWRSMFRILFNPANEETIDTYFKIKSL